MNKFLKKASAFVLATALAITPAIGVMAAPEDIIDTSKKATLTIHKYDLSAATEDGVDITQFANNGQKDAQAEATMSNYVIEGVEFSYVRVGSINTESEGGNIKLLYDIPKELETALGLTDSRGDRKHTSDELNNALKDTLMDNTAGKNKLEDYIKGANGKTAMPLTDANGVTQATGMPLGLYLLVETKVPANVNTTVDPFFVSLPMTDETGDYWFYDVDVYPKNQCDIPDLDKVVRQHDDAELYNKPEFTDTATASEGDVVDFLFVSHLPKITSKATYLSQYTFVDKMDKGISYNKDTAIYFYDNEADARANNTAKAVKSWPKDSGAFAATYQDASGNIDANIMTITPTADGLNEIDPSLSQHWLVVAYTGTVNSDATPVLGDEGNDNQVTLTWRRTSMDYPDTLEDIARVYTFGINLTKTFSETGDPTKVQFKLKNETDGHYVVAKTAAGVPGVYYLTDAVKGQAEENGTVFSPAKDGTLVINGLEANKYVMTEIKTDAGYSLLKEPMVIDITCTVDDITPSKTTLYDIIDIANNPNKNLIDTRVSDAHATVDGKVTNMSTHDPKNINSANARVDMNVLNTKTFVLPQTGGAGTLMFTLAAAGFAFAGIFVATRKPKKEA